LIDEENRIKSIIRNGFTNSKFNYYEIYLLAKYFLWSCNYDKKSTQKSIIDFCQLQDKNFNLINDQNLINNAVDKAFKNDIKKSKNVFITFNEIKNIEKLKNFKFQKLAFIMLVWAKKSSRNSSNLYYFSRDNFSLAMKTARIKMGKREFNDFKFLMTILDLIEPCKPGFKLRNYDILLYGDDRSKKIIEIGNETNIVEKYINYYGGEIVYCKNCGIMVIKGSNRQKFCSKCFEVIRKNKKKSFMAKKRKNVDS